MGDLLGPPGSCRSSGAGDWPELALVEVERRWILEPLWRWLPKDAMRGMRDREEPG